MVTRKLFTTLDQLNIDYEKSQRSKTVYGYYLNLTGYVFSVYCIIKLTTSTLNVLFGTKSTDDQVLNYLHVVFRVLGVKADNIDFLATQLSFLLVGFMAIQSIRGIFLQFSRITPIASSSLSSDTVILLMAHIMGFYFQSVVLLLRTSLPLQYRYV